MVSLARVSPGDAAPKGALGGLLEPVLARFTARRPGEDTALIVRAGRAAAAAHDGEVRRTGEPYVTHPIAVAGIVADLGWTSHGGRRPAA